MMQLLGEYVCSAFDSSTKHSRSNARAAPLVKSILDLSLQNHIVLNKLFSFPIEPDVLCYHVNQLSLLCL